MTDHSQTSANYVRLFDTTLRDGEQSPGATMTSAEKLEVARALSRLGVDVIEAGFPAASPDDLAAVKRIAETVGQEVPEGRPSSEPPSICGLARATIKDIDRAWEAVQPARKPRIHTFLATSPIHREHKLRLTKEQVVAKTREMVAYASSLCPDVEFSPEDAGRTEPEFLYEVLQAAIESGATTLNIPDTVGYTLPDEFGALIAGIMKNVRDIRKATVSVHCHNDLGLATANAIAGIRAGARQAEVTVNGIGERAGNTAIEEVVMALRTRHPVFGLETGIDTTQLVRASRLVSSRTGIAVQPNKAIVGANAFAHESGIHQDGMLKNAETYEIMRPEVVGAAKTHLVLGKHSGRHAFAVRLRELGYPLDSAAIDEAFARFKILADKKKRITDADLEALAASQEGGTIDLYHLEGLQVACGTLGMPTATVRLRDEAGTVHTVAAVGSGPLHAVVQAIDSIVGEPAELLEFSLNAITGDMDAQAESSIRLRGGSADDDDDGTTRPVFHGHAADTDIIVASTKAYLAALNRLVAANRAQVQPERKRLTDPPAAGTGI
jgi:2-isopropylmalate synthase